jgi:hypothetical protein
MPLTRFELFVSRIHAKSVPAVVAESNLKRATRVYFPSLLNVSPFWFVSLTDDEVTCNPSDMIATQSFIKVHRLLG